MASLIGYRWCSYLVLVASIYRVPTVCSLSLSSISPVCSCEIRRQEGACGPLLGGCPGSPRWADGRGISLVFYCRSTRMMQFLLLTWYLGPTWYLVPASTCLGVIFDSAVVSSLLSVCCCHTSQMIHSQAQAHARW